MNSTCPQGHPIKGAEDLYRSGHCKQCQKQWSRDYRRRASLALREKTQMFETELDRLIAKALESTTSDEARAQLQRLIETSRGDIINDPQRARTATKTTRGSLDARN